MGSTGLTVSPIGLGTVKFGRNQKIKYPHFELPSDREVEGLLDLALELGINTLDTAPAYGIAEERIGKLLHDREFIIITKTGEDFSDGESRYDFSARHTRTSIERSLQRLNRPVLDCVLLHCDADDLETVDRSGAIPTLQALKDRGDIRSFGASISTVPGGFAALRTVDVLMVTYNPSAKEMEPVIQEAARLGKGILIKKAFGSGRLADGSDGVEQCALAAFELAGVSSLIAGTINPSHLRANVAAVRKALALQ